MPQLLGQEHQNDQSRFTLPLVADICYLVLEHVDSWKDLCNLCLVSKAFYSVATLRLHRYIVFRPTRWEHASRGFPFRNVKQEQRKPWDYIYPLLCRLLDETNTDLRNAVREIEIGDFPEHEMETSIWPDLAAMNALPRLVDSLRNLRQFRIRCTLPITEEFIHSLCNHRNKPELHLLSETIRRDSINHMPCVTRIVSSVNPFKERLTGNRRAQNREMLRLQELFFACPNLRSFSIDVYGNYGGCVRKMPLFPRVLCFQLTGSETFPPLEHLSLDGYKFGVEEWPHWRQKFSWGNLRSLSLGPQKCEVVLSLIKTCTLNLKSLRVEKYSDNGPGDVLPDLESFLGSFNTLERLTVNGYSVSSAGISNHPNLKHFCMHTIEPFNSDTTRKTLEPMELYDLDINCPHLESLHLDIQRDGEWPRDMLAIIAGGFENLRELHLHFELGLHEPSRHALFGTATSKDTDAGPLAPFLVGHSAKELCDIFLEARAPSKLRKLTFRTGERLRRFTQWLPTYARWEKENSRAFEINLPVLPGEKPQIKALSDDDYLKLAKPPVESDEP